MLRVRATRSIAHGECVLHESQARRLPAPLINKPSRTGDPRPPPPPPIVGSYVRRRVSNAGQYLPAKFSTLLASKAREGIDYYFEPAVRLIFTLLWHVTVGREPTHCTARRNIGCTCTHVVCVVLFFPCFRK